MPKTLIVERYFAAKQAAIREQEATLEAVAAQMAEMEKEHGGEEGAFSELDKVNKANVTDRLRELRMENGELIIDNGRSSGVIDNEKLNSLKTINYPLSTVHCHYH